MHAHVHACMYVCMHACVQAAEMRTADVCGFDMSAINRHRWHPGHTAGLPVYLFMCASFAFHVSVRMSVLVCSLRCPPAFLFGVITCDHLFEA